MARVFKRALPSVMGAGTVYLFRQMYDYNFLAEKMGHESFSDDVVTQPAVTADKKEWLILGRQSPGYARAGKPSKNNLLKKISMSGLVIKELGAVIDNEKHYDLFESSDFQVELFSSRKDEPQVVVKPDMMLGMGVDSIDDAALFEVGFARKQGFADWSQKSPLFHSSIALRQISKVDAEANPDAVVMTGAEIKKIIDNTNADVCESQHCDLYNSNCYSASTYMMGEMIKTIDGRKVNEQQETSDIHKVWSTLRTAAFDNLARGVSNNPVVNVQLTTSVPRVLKEHGLLQKPAEIAGIQKTKT